MTGWVRCQDGKERESEREGGWQRETSLSMSEHVQSAFEQAEKLIYKTLPRILHVYIDWRCPTIPVCLLHTPFTFWSSSLCLHPLHFKVHREDLCVSYLLYSSQLVGPCGKMEGFCDIELLPIFSYMLPNSQSYMCMWLINGID